MRKIDAFAHILPRAYLSRLERQLEQTMAPSQLDYYRQGVFSFDPVLTDLDARWRKIEPYGDYAQVLVLAVPPPEEVGPLRRLRGRAAALGRRPCLARASLRPLRPDVPRQR